MPALSSRCKKHPQKTCAFPKRLLRPESVWQDTRPGFSAGEASQARCGGVLRGSRFALHQMMFSSLDLQGLASQYPCFLAGLAPRSSF